MACSHQIHPHEVCNPVMIAISAAIYDFMLQEIKGNNSEHHRYGGDALADVYSMLQGSNKASKHKEIISQELQVLECIRRVDKSTLPPTLTYRDRGECSFPTSPLLKV